MIVLWQIGIIHWYLSRREVKKLALPLILATLAVGAVTKGVSSTGKGINNLKRASVAVKELELKNKKNIEYFEKKCGEVTEYLDELGKKELEIFESFKKFSDIVEKIQNRPVFKGYSKKGLTIPSIDYSKIERVSLTAATVLSGLGSAGVGIAGGIATGGVTTTLVTTFGVASTGTAISGLSGVAGTNALFATLGGGSLAVGGGGVAAGTVLLGGTTLGIGLLAGGYLFEKYTNTLNDKVDIIARDIEKTAKNITKICQRLDRLEEVAKKFKGALVITNRIYQNHLNQMEEIVINKGKVDWNFFTDEEKITLENTVLLVGLLYNLGKTKLLLNGEDEIEKINEDEVLSVAGNTKEVLEEKGLRKI